jgi:hypothetical protein
MGTLLRAALAPGGRRQPPPPQQQPAAYRSTPQPASPARQQGRSGGAPRIGAAAAAARPRRAAAGGSSTIVVPYKRIQSNGLSMCNVGIAPRNGWGSLVVHNIHNIDCVIISGRVGTTARSCTKGAGTGRAPGSKPRGRWIKTISSNVSHQQLVVARRLISERARFPPGVVNELFSTPKTPKMIPVPSSV